MITKNRTKTVLAFALLAMALLVGSANAAVGDPILNAGFETPDQGDAGYTNPYPPTGVPGWTFAGGSGLGGPTSPWACNSTSPDPLGDQFAYLQGAASISGTLTGLVATESYTLEFFESYRTAYATNDLSVILDKGETSEVTIYNNPDVTNATWEKRTTSSFVATKSSYTLTFEATWPAGTGDCTTIIDGVDWLDPTRPDVDAGTNKINWSGNTLQLAPNVTNNDLPALLTFAWYADPNDGVVFVPPSAIEPFDLFRSEVEDPQVMITRSTDNPTVVTLTLSANNVGSSRTDTLDSMTIKLYDDPCLAAIGAGVTLDQGDLDGDCLTGLADFAEMSAAWDDDYTLIAPVPRP